MINDTNPFGHPCGSSSEEEDTHGKSHSIYLHHSRRRDEPLDWHFPFLDEEMGRYSRELLFSSNALLMGRENYEGFAGVWSKQTAADDAPGASGFEDRINSMPKFVASTTLKDPLEWNATLINQDVVEAVTTLKQQLGQDILMYGAGPVGTLLLKHGLVDELHFLVHPVIWGDGHREFEKADDLPAMELVDTKTFTSGIVLLTYQPARYENDE